MLKTTDNGTATWPEIIEYSTMLRKQLHTLNPRIYPSGEPAPGAPAKELAQACQHLGFNLDPQHRTVLSQANGWEAFCNFAPLFGTADIAFGPIWLGAQKILDEFYDKKTLPRDFPKKEDLYIVAGNPGQQNDVFAIWTAGPKTSDGCPVLWLANYEIARFADMREWFFFANDYLQNKVVGLKKELNDL